MAHCSIQQQLMSLLLTFLASTTLPGIAGMPSKGKNNNNQLQTQELLIGWHGESYVGSQQASQQPGQSLQAEEAAEETAVAAEGEPQIIPVHAPAPVPGRSFTIDVSTARSGAISAAASKVSTAGTHHSSRIQMLSWQPRLQLHHSFLTAQECDDLRALLSTSTDGKPPSADSTSLMMEVEQRIANWTKLPPTHNEGWQLQHGFGSDERQLHMDLLIDRLATEDFQRLRAATVMLFLSDADAGNNTSNSAGPATSSSSGVGGSSWSVMFPSAKGGTWQGAAQPDDAWPNLATGQQVQHQLMAAGLKAAAQNKGRRNEWEMLSLQHPSSSSSDGSSSSSSGGAGGSTDVICTSAAARSYGALRLTGFRKGDALLLWNVMVDGTTPDASAAHVVCPPERRSGDASSGGQTMGGPWVATTWLHNMAISHDDPLALAAACVDKNPSCRSWAEQGFCDDAPGFMLGLRGDCRLSCQDCVPCKRAAATQPGVSVATTSDGNAAARLSLDLHSATEAVAALQTATASSSSGSSPGAMADGTLDYVECLYRNMHSLRAAWSEQARGAGVRRARNAIKRELRVQAALAAAGAAGRGVGSQHAGMMQHMQ